MLALNGKTTPVIGAGAYHHAGDSIWMTTSRFAEKIKLIKRNPRAAFLVTEPGQSLMVQGVVELYDLRSASGQLRALLNGPTFYTGMAGYTLKNLTFIGGYLLELDRVPGRWWPHNRLVMRFRIHRARRVETPIDTLADPATVPGIPRDLARRLARTAVAHACWRGRGGLVLEPCYWASDNGAVSIAFEPGATSPLEDETPAAVVIEKHHPFRPTLMVGASFRGRLLAEAQATRLVTARFGMRKDELGPAFAVASERVSYWKGFQTESR